MLAIRDLTKTYRGPAGPLRVLRGLSLDVAAGEVVAVQGRSGSGKTTLLLAAGGLLHPDGGTIRVADQDLYALGDEARARFRAAHVGFVFQQFHLIPYLTAFENVLAAALALRVPGARARAEELLAALGLAERRDHVPAELSTGERQRTALARALLHRPPLLLADEPTGNLDRDSAEIVLTHLTAFARAGGAVLLATHDNDAAARAQRVVRLEASAPPAPAVGATA